MIKLLCLNIEGSRHLDRVIPFLQRERPDVVCLQEVFKFDYPVLKETLGYDGIFVPMVLKDVANEFTAQPNGILGIALFTRCKHSSFEAKYYVGTGTAPRHIMADAEDRVLVWTTVKDGKDWLTVGTTHFSWTPDGEPNQRQRNALCALLAIAPKDLVLCGDFNAPRGGEIFTAFTKHFKDNLPPDVVSTIDPDLHRKKGLSLAVDTIFSTPQYAVENVRVIDGISDHKALVGTIKRK